MISSVRFPVKFHPQWLGLASVALLAMVSYLIVSLPFMASSGISPLVIAILLGMVTGNVISFPATWTPGIQFAAKRILRTAIILYGFRVSFQQIASVGFEAIVIDTLVVTLTLSLGYWVGRRWFKLDRDLALLISAGTAICGAAAVLAVEDILKSQPHKTAVAIGTVVLFGTISMFIYPLLQHANLFGFTDNQFGVFAGASIHEVAQALVAGSNVSVEAGKVAVIVKMMRVMLLVPALFAISYFFKSDEAQSATNYRKIVVPWFALGFIAVIAFNSLNLLPSQLVDHINQIDILLLTMAMGAIGIETKFAKIKQVGVKPLYLALGLFVWLLASVVLMVKVVH